MEKINYFREFLQSKLHVWIGATCLAIAGLSGSWFLLILAAIIYGLSLTFVQDMPFFKNKIDEKFREISKKEDQERLLKFKKLRETQINSLVEGRKLKYYNLSMVCKEIEKATTDQVSVYSDTNDSDGRLRKIDELMYTYLKLLLIEQSLEKFVDSENMEELDLLIKKAESEISEVAGAIEKMKKENEVSPTETRMKRIESKQRLFTSYTDRLDVLNRRIGKSDQAKTNLQLILAEQERLVEQIKLLRAEAIASRNADAISMKIDASVSQIDETNKWILEMGEFKDVVAEMPHSSERIGFETPYSVKIGLEDSSENNNEKTRKKSIKSKYTYI